MVFIYIILSTVIISAFSLVGVATLAFNDKFLRKILLSLVALSTGSLLGGAFLHLIPEAVEAINVEFVLQIVLVSFILFFLVEKMFHWRHCHKKDCDVHTFGYLNLAGDAIHNFTDGLIIAAAFMVNVPIGITTSVALAFHEIPQEIGDFGVLLHAGFEKKKALLFNFMVALTSVLGGVIGYFLSSKVEILVHYFLPIAAGGFIYIATSDLIPELRKEVERKKSITSFILFLIGVGIMYLLTLVV